jgi:RNA polymerase sigma-70 factor (ECF subfamily)
MNTPTPDEQDAHDMARLVDGHEAALNELMDRHGRRLFNYLIRALQDEQDAADLAQETFAKVYHSRERFDPRQRFSTWLYAIATNLVRDRYRWRSRHPQVSLEAEGAGTETALMDTLTTAGPLPHQCLQTQERAEAVRKAVAGLPDELRQPLILAAYEDLPQAEIALILNCTVKAVETRLYRARQHLRARLGPLLPEL